MSTERKPVDMSAQHTPTRRRSETDYPKRSPAARSICEPRWVGWHDGKSKQKDPCDGCPLNRPCVKQGNHGPGLEAFTSWITGINEAAAALAKAGVA